MAGRVLSAHDEAADCRIGERLGWQVLIGLACSGSAQTFFTLNITNITCYVTGPCLGWHGCKQKSVK